MTKIYGPQPEPIEIDSLREDLAIARAALVAIKNVCAPGMPGRALQPKIARAAAIEALEELDKRNRQRRQRRFAVGYNS